MIVGIDPGMSGAIAFVEKNGAHVEDMPVAGKQVDAAGLAHLLSGKDGREITHVFVEDVHAMPGQGVTSMFSFGRSVGVIAGVVAALGLPITYVTPGKWKKHFSLTRDKGLSRRRALELFPQLASDLKRVKDDGRAEALLIAEYGRRYLCRPDQIK